MLTLKKKNRIFQFRIKTLAHAGLGLSLILGIGLLSGCGGGGDNADKPAGEEKTDSASKTEGDKKAADKKVETKPAADPQEVKAYLDSIKTKLDTSIQLPKGILKEAERFRTAHKKEKKWRDNHIFVTLGPEGNVMDVKFNTKYPSIDTQDINDAIEKALESVKPFPKPPTGGNPNFIFMIRLLGDKTYLTLADAEDLKKSDKNDNGFDDVDDVDEPDEDEAEKENSDAGSDAAGESEE